MNGRVVHPSKVDLWLRLVLYGSSFAMLFASYQIYKDIPNSTVGLVITGLMLAGAALPIWILHSTRYIIDGERLLIRAGPCRMTVPISAIREVKPTRTVLSSPALSLDRMRISYEGSKWGVVISPADQAAFLRDLTLRNNKLQLTADGCSRASP